MKPLTFVLIFNILICVPHVHSQSIVRSTTGAGGSSQIVISDNKSYFVSQSIGQPGVIGASTSGGMTIRQGFQQPLHTYKIGMLDELSDLKAIVYPNPFQQSINISFMDIVNEEIAVIVHDISGRIIIKETHPASQLITLTLKYMAIGEYILNVTAGKKHLTTSIIKK